MIVNKELSVIPINSTLDIIPINSSQKQNRESIPEQRLGPTRGSEPLIFTFSCNNLPKTHVSTQCEALGQTVISAHTSRPSCKGMGQPIFCTV